MYSLLFAYLIYSRLFISVLPTSLFSMNHFAFSLGISILSTGLYHFKWMNIFVLQGLINENIRYTQQPNEVPHLGLVLQIAYLIIWRKTSSLIMVLNNAWLHWYLIDNRLKTTLLEFIFCTQQLCSLKKTRSTILYCILELHT